MIRRFWNYLKLTLAGKETAPHTKPFVFSKTWMRLYRFNDFYVDLIYSGNRHGAVIQGELQATKPIGARVSLIMMHNTKESILEEHYVTKSGPFRFVLKEPGEYQFIAQIDDWVKELTRIDVGEKTTNHNLEKSSPPQPKTRALHQ